MQKVTLSLLVLGLSVSPMLQAENNPVSEEVLDLADKDLLPTRVPLADRENSFLKIVAISKDRSSDASDLMSQMEIPNNPNKYSAKERTALLAFREKHLGQRDQLMKTTTQRCQVPDTNTMHVVNLTSAQDTFYALLTADMVYAEEKKMPSSYLKRILSSYLAYTKNFLHCDGSMIQSIIGIGQWSAISDYMIYFTKSGALKQDDAVLLNDLYLTDMPDRQFLMEQLKREYKYGYLAPITLMTRSFTQTKPADRPAFYSFIFDLKETVDRTSALIREYVAALNHQEYLSTEGKEALAFAKYTDVSLKKNKELMGFVASIRKLAEGGTLHGPGTEDIPADIAVKHPELKNYLGRTVLHILSSNQTSRWNETTKDILKARLKGVTVALTTHQKTFHDNPKTLNDLVTKGILERLPQNNLTKHRLAYDAKDGIAYWAYEGDAKEYIKLEP